jgi:hypothetical protein
MTVLAGSAPAPVRSTEVASSANIASLQGEDAR